MSALCTWQELPSSSSAYTQKRVCERGCFVVVCFAGSHAFFIIDLMNARRLAFSGSSPANLSERAGRVRVSEHVLDRAMRLRPHGCVCGY